MEWQIAMMAKMDQMGWNQSRLAKELGVSRQTASNLLTKPPATKGSALVEPASKLVGLTLLPLWIDEEDAKLFDRIIKVRDGWPEEYARISERTEAAVAHLDKRRAR